MRSSKRRLKFLFYDSLQTTTSEKESDWDLKSSFVDNDVFILQCILITSHFAKYQCKILEACSLPFIQSDLDDEEKSEVYANSFRLCLHLFCHARNRCTVTKRHHIDACKLRKDYKAVYSTLSLLK